MAFQQEMAFRDLRQLKRGKLLATGMEEDDVDVEMVQWESDYRSWELEEAKKGGETEENLRYQGVVSRMNAFNARILAKDEEASPDAEASTNTSPDPPANPNLPPPKNIRLPPIRRT